MTNIAHPSKNLAPEKVAIIRSSTQAAENAGHLVQGQLDLIHHENWLNLFVPAKYGGLDLSLPEAVRLEESLAWADGSLGWVVTLCSGAAMFVGFFEPRLADEVFSVPRVCLAGSGQVAGVADETPDGYEVTGCWPYSSGSLHATHFTANCVIRKNGITQLHADGTEVIRSFIFEKQEITLLPKWKYMGLNATAGHSYKVEKLKVARHRSFVIAANAVSIPGAVYRYPFLQMAEATLAVNTSGMCLYFLDLCGELLNERSANPRSQAVKNKGQQLLSDALSECENLRVSFYQVLDQSYDEQLSSSNTRADTLAEVSRASKLLAGRTRSWVNELYPYVGLAGAHIASPINQVWRNIHTASQHTLLIRTD